MKNTMTASEQARADAKADAETLLLNVPVADYSVDFQCWIAGQVRLALNDAQAMGHMASAGPATFAAERATIAARSAFRAVPGLR